MSVAVGSGLAGGFSALPPVGIIADPVPIRRPRQDRAPNWLLLIVVQSAWRIRSSYVAGLALNASRKSS